MTPAAVADLGLVGVVVVSVVVVVVGNDVPLLPAACVGCCWINDVDGELFILAAFATFWSPRSLAFCVSVSGRDVFADVFPLVTMLLSSPCANSFMALRPSCVN